MGDQQPNVFIRTNLIRVPKGIQAPLVLAYTEVIQVRYLYTVYNITLTGMHNEPRGTWEGMILWSKYIYM